MAKIQNISEIHPTLGFTEFDILERYRKSFHESELGRLHSVFPFEHIAKTVGLSDQHLGRRNIFSPCAKIALMVLKAYTGFSDRQLVEHLNGNIHYQMFCGIMINPSSPITNYKIVSAIRNEMASRLDIDSLQEVLASHWKPYLENLHVCMTDATCYESHMRFPTDMKLLWESLEWLYRHISLHCRDLGIRRPRNKYADVAKSYLSYCKKRKASRTSMLKRRMIRLLPDFVTQKTYILQLFDKQYFASLRHLILGDAKGVLTMFIRKKRHRSGNIGVIVVEKIGGKMKELATIGVAYNEDEVENLVYEAKEWIYRENSRRHPQLDLFGDEREACDREREEVRRVLSNVSNILLNGCDLILDRTFDRIGFNRKTMMCSASL